MFFLVLTCVELISSKNFWSVHRACQGRRVSPSRRPGSSAARMADRVLQSTYSEYVLRAHGSSGVQRLCPNSSVRLLRYAGDAKAEELKSCLDNVMSVPEQLFGDNFLRLTHLQSGTVLEYSALQALRGWRELRLPPVQVGHAREWTQARHSEIQQHAAVTLDYDWSEPTHCVLHSDINSQKSRQCSIHLTACSLSIWQGSADAACQLQQGSTCNCFVVAV